MGRVARLSHDARWVAEERQTVHDEKNSLLPLSEIRADFACTIWGHTLCRPIGSHGGREISKGLEQDYDCRIFLGPGMTRFLHTTEELPLEGGEISSMYIYTHNKYTRDICMDVYRRGPQFAASIHFCSKTSIMFHPSFRCYARPLHGFNLLPIKPAACRSSNF